MGADLHVASVVFHFHRSEDGPITERQEQVNTVYVADKIDGAPRKWWASFVAKG